MPASLLCDDLRAVRAFSHFDDEALTRLAACGTQRGYTAGAEIFRPSEPRRALYAVAGGRVHLERPTPVGRLVLGRFVHGELFGESGYFDGGAHDDQAVADSDAEIWELSAAALAEQAAADRRFELALLWAMWRSLSGHLRRANARLGEFFGPDTETPSAPSAAVGASEPGFRIALAAKRDLFTEQRLSDMEIHFLSSLSREERFAAGSVIFSEGEDGDALYVVLDGQVMISTRIPGAGEEALAFLERGDYFGEMALIDHQPRSATATAHEDGAVVLAIPRDVLGGILDIRKVSSVRLLQVLCSLVYQRVRQSNEKLVGWHMLAGGTRA